MTWIEALERLARNADITADEFGDEPEKQERLREEASELREIASYLSGSELPAAAPSPMPSAPMPHRGF
jgi:hypothetical protein